MKQDQINKEPIKGKLEKFKEISFNNFEFSWGTSVIRKIPTKGKLKTYTSKLEYIILIIWKNNQSTKKIKIVFISDGNRTHVSVVKGRRPNL